MSGYLDLAREALAALPQQRACHRYEVNELNEQSPSWDQTAADDLMVRLRTEVATVEATFGGRPPTALANVLADALAIACGYVANHELEARRGWDALALLRGMVPHVRRCVQNWKQAQESQEAAP
jgi:hypothetical protein